MQNVDVHRPGKRAAPGGNLATATDGNIRGREMSNTTIAPSARPVNVSHPVSRDNHPLAAREIAELQRKVLRGAALKPTVRLVLMFLLSNRTRDNGRQIVVDGWHINGIANTLGMDRKTTGDVVKALHAGAIIVPEEERYTENALGERIPTRFKEVTDNNRWRVKSTFYLNVDILLFTLASGEPLRRTTYEDKQARKARDIRALIHNATCPRCGGIGCLEGHVTARCTNDKCVDKNGSHDLTDAQIDDILAPKERKRKGRNSPNTRREKRMGEFLPLSGGAR